MRSLTLGKVALHLTVAVLVILWSLPTAGILVTSFRDKAQISQTGWWTAPFRSELNARFVPSSADGQTQINGSWVLEGNIFEDGSDARVIAFAATGRKLNNEAEATAPGEVADLRRGLTAIVYEDGGFRIESPNEITRARDGRFAYRASQRPSFRL